MMVLEGAREGGGVAFVRGGSAGADTFSALPRGNAENGDTWG